MSFRLLPTPKRGGEGVETFSDEPPLPHSRREGVGKGGDAFTPLESRAIACNSEPLRRTSCAMHNSTVPDLKDDLVRYIDRQIALVRSECMDAFNLHVDAKVKEALRLAGIRQAADAGWAHEVARPCSPAWTRELERHRSTPITGHRSDCLQTRKHGATREMATQTEHTQKRNTQTRNTQTQTRTPRGPT